jgi:hypothetical protein
MIRFDYGEEEGTSREYQQSHAPDKSDPPAGLTSTFWLAAEDNCRVNSRGNSCRLNPGLIGSRVEWRQ